MGARGEQPLCMIARLEPYSVSTSLTSLDVRSDGWNLIGSKLCRYSLNCTRTRTCLARQPASLPLTGRPTTASRYPADSAMRCHPGAWCAETVTQEGTSTGLQTTISST